MNVVYICQTVDSDDYKLATFVKWIRAFSHDKRVGRLSVICLRAGKYDLPGDVRIYPISGRMKLITLFNFYKVAICLAMRKETDLYFIQMGGPYPLLLLPIKWLLKIPIFQWKTHPHINLVMRISAEIADDMIFTATPNSFPTGAPNVFAIGHGIDTNIFYPMRIPKTIELVTVGRIAPIKNIELMLGTVAAYRDRFGKSLKLSIYGPCLEHDANYLEKLKILIHKLNLEETVRLSGPLRQQDLPLVLNRHQVFLSFSNTGLDKALLEAIACGLSVLSTNDCFRDFLPETLCESFYEPKHDPEILAQKLYNILHMNSQTKQNTLRFLGELVLEQHSIDTIADRILSKIETFGLPSEKKY